MTSSQELDSHVTGTGKVVLNSGSDTSLKGVVVTGGTVIANVGGLFVRYDCSCSLQCQA